MLVRVALNIYGDEVDDRVKLTVNNYFNQLNHIFERLVGTCAMRSARRRCSEEDQDSDVESGGDFSMVRQSKNRVFFHVGVSRKTILDLIEKLEAAETYALTNHLPCVLLFLHSEGGDAHAGLSGMNHIQNSRIPVHTVADGFVASAATLLLLGGARRFGMEHSSVLIHQMSTGFWGKYVEMIDEMHNTEQMMEMIRTIYCSKTKLQRKRLEKTLKKEVTMTAAQCMELGIIQEFYKANSIIT